ncbi:MAG: hypothetical protein R6X02_29390 [Enhygromyxa sp.]
MIRHRSVQVLTALIFGNLLLTGCEQQLSVDHDEPTDLTLVDPTLVDPSLDVQEGDCLHPDVFISEMVGPQDVLPDVDEDGRRPFEDADQVCSRQEHIEGVATTLSSSQQSISQHCNYVYSQDDYEYYSCDPIKCNGVATWWRSWTRNCYECWSLPSWSWLGVNCGAWFLTGSGCTEPHCYSI